MVKVWSIRDYEVFSFVEIIILYFFFYDLEVIIEEVERKYDLDVVDDYKRLCFLDIIGSYIY